MSASRVGVSLFVTAVLLIPIVFAHADQKAADAMCKPYHTECPCDQVLNAEKKCVDGGAKSNTHACKVGVCKDTTDGYTSLGLCSAEEKCVLEKTAEGNAPSKPTEQQIQDSLQKGPAGTPPATGLNPGTIGPGSSVMQAALGYANNPSAGTGGSGEFPAPDSNSANNFTSLMDQLNLNSQNTPLGSDSFQSTQNQDMSIGAELQRWGASVFGSGNTQTLDVIGPDGQPTGEQVSVQSFNPNGSTFSQGDSSGFGDQNAQPSGCGSWWCPIVQAAENGLKAVGDALFSPAEAKNAMVQMATTFYDPVAGQGGRLDIYGNRINAMGSTMASNVLPQLSIQQACLASCEYVLVTDTGAQADLIRGAAERIGLTEDMGVAKVTYTQVAQASSYSEGMAQVAALNAPLPTPNPMRLADSAITSAVTSGWGGSYPDVPSGQTVTQQFLDASSQQIQSNVLASANVGVEPFSPSVPVSNESGIGGVDFSAIEPPPSGSANPLTGTEPAAIDTGYSLGVHDPYSPQGLTTTDAGKMDPEAIFSSGYLNVPHDGAFIAESSPSQGGTSPSTGTEPPPGTIGAEQQLSEVQQQAQNALDAQAQLNQTNRDLVAAQTPSWLETANQFLSNPGKEIADATQSFLEESRVTLSNFESYFNISNAPNDTVGSALDTQTTAQQNFLESQQNIQNASNDTVGSALADQERAASLYDQEQAAAAQQLKLDEEAQLNARFDQATADENAFNTAVENGVPKPDTTTAPSGEAVADQILNTGDRTNPLLGLQKQDTTQPADTSAANSLEGLLTPKGTTEERIDGYKQLLGADLNNKSMQGAFVDGWRAGLVSELNNHITDSQQKLDALPSSDRTPGQEQQAKDLESSIASDKALIAKQVEIFNAPTANMTPEQLQKYIDNNKSFISGFPADTPGIVSGIQARIAIAQAQLQTWNDNVATQIEAMTFAGRRDNPGPVDGVAFEVNKVLAENPIDTWNASPEQYMKAYLELQGLEPAPAVQPQLIGAGEQPGNLAGGSVSGGPVRTVGTVAINNADVATNPTVLAGPDAKNPPLSSSFETYAFEAQKPISYADFQNYSDAKTGQPLTPEQAAGFSNFTSASGGPLTPEQAAALNQTDIAGNKPDTQSTKTVTDAQPPAVVRAESAVEDLRSEVAGLRRTLDNALISGKINAQDAISKIDSAKETLAEARNTTAGLKGTDSDFSNINSASSKLNALSDKLNQLESALKNNPDGAAQTVQQNAASIKTALSNASNQIAIWNDALPDPPTHQVTITNPGAPYAYTVPSMSAGQGVPFADTYAQYQSGQFSNTSVPAQLTGNWEPVYPSDNLFATQQDYGYIAAQFPAQSPSETAPFTLEEAPASQLQLIGASEAQNGLSGGTTAGTIPSAQEIAAEASPLQQPGDAAANNPNAAQQEQQQKDLEAKISDAQTAQAAIQAKLDAVKDNLAYAPSAVKLQNDIDKLGSEVAKAQKGLAMVNSLSWWPTPAQQAVIDAGTAATKAIPGTLTSISNNSEFSELGTSVPKGLASGINDYTQQLPQFAANQDRAGMTSAASPLLSSASGFVSKAQGAFDNTYDPEELNVKGLQSQQATLQSQLNRTVADIQTYQQQIGQFPASVPAQEPPPIVISDTHTVNPTGPLAYAWTPTYPSDNLFATQAEINAQFPAQSQPFIPSSPVSNESGIGFNFSDIQNISAPAVIPSNDAATAQLTAEEDLTKFVQSALDSISPKAPIVSNESGIGVDFSAFQNTPSQQALENAFPTQQDYSQIAEQFPAKSEPPVAVSIGNSTGASSEAAALSPEPSPMPTATWTPKIPETRSLPAVSVEQPVEVTPAKELPVATPIQETPVTEVSAATPVSAPASVQAPPKDFARSYYEIGDTGGDIKNVQKFLNTNGYPVSQSGDGSLGHETDAFGAKTLAAVKAFQRANGLAADGYVGTKTLAAMNRILKQGH